MHTGEKCMRFLRSPAWTPAVIIAIAFLLYPVIAYWVWGGGWISQRGFYDFGGGATVHLLAGICALMGALVAGPRFNHIWGTATPPLLTIGLGVALTAFGLFAYHPAGMAEYVSSVSGTVAINGGAAIVSGALAALMAASFRRDTWQFGAMLSGAVAGAAAISAGWIWMTPLGAAVTGGLAGLTAIGVAHMLNALRVDDSLGIFATHGIGGALGTLLVGVFLTGTPDGAAGILMGGGSGVLTNQFFGLTGIILFVGIVSTSLLYAIKSSGYLRAPQPRQRVMLFEEHDYDTSATDIPA